MNGTKAFGRIVRGIAVIGTVFALLLAGGAPSDHTHAVVNSFVSGAQ